MFYHLGALTLSVRVRVLKYYLICLSMVEKHVLVHFIAAFVQVDGRKITHSFWGSKNYSFFLGHIAISQPILKLVS